MGQRVGGSMSPLARALGDFHRTHATEQPAQRVAPPAAAGPQAKVFAHQPWDAATSTVGMGQPCCATSSSEGRGVATG